MSAVATIENYLIVQTDGVFSDNDSPDFHGVSCGVHEAIKPCTWSISCSTSSAMSATVVSSISR